MRGRPDHRPLARPIYPGQRDGQWDNDPAHCGFGDNSSQDKIVVLDWGRPINLTGYGSPYNGYGTVLAKQTPSPASEVRNDEIVYLTEQYAESYFWNSGGLNGCPQTRVTLGTNNSYPCNGSPGGYCSNYDSGRAWGDAV